MIPMTTAKDEIHIFGQIISKLRANREVHAKELIERGMKLEADLCAAEPLRIEVIQLRANAQKLNASRHLARSFRNSVLTERYMPRS